MAFFCTPTDISGSKTRLVIFGTTASPDRFKAVMNFSGMIEPCSGCSLMDQKFNSLGKLARVISEVFGRTQFPFLFWFVPQKVFFVMTAVLIHAICWVSLIVELGEDSGTDGTSLIAGLIDSWCLDRRPSFLFWPILLIPASTHLASRQALQHNINITYFSIDNILVWGTRLSTTCTWLGWICWLSRCQEVGSSSSPSWQIGGRRLYMSGRWWRHIAWNPGYKLSWARGVSQLQSLITCCSWRRLHTRHIAPQPVLLAQALLSLLSLALMSHQVPSQGFDSWSPQLAYCSQAYYRRPLVSGLEPTETCSVLRSLCTPVLRELKWQREKESDHCWVSRGSRRKWCPRHHFWLKFWHYFAHALINLCPGNTVLLINRICALLETTTYQALTQHQQWAPVESLTWPGRERRVSVKLGHTPTT